MIISVNRMLSSPTLGPSLLQSPVSWSSHTKQTVRNHSLISPNSRPGLQANSRLIVSFTICLYWTTVESGIALLTSCLPSCFGLYNNMRRKAKDYSRTYGSGSRSRSWGSRSGLMGFRRKSTTLGGHSRHSRLGSDAGTRRDLESGRKSSVVVQPRTARAEELALQDLQQHR